MSRWLQGEIQGKINPTFRTWRPRARSQLWELRRPEVFLDGIHEL